MPRAGRSRIPKPWRANLAATLMKIEQVPDIPMFRQNTAAFVHDLPHAALSNVEGDSNYVRVQVLTNAGALDRDKQLAVVRQFTDLVAAAAGDASLAEQDLGVADRGGRRRVGTRWPCQHQRGARRCRARTDCGAPARKSIRRVTHQETRTEALWTGDLMTRTMNGTTLTLQPACSTWRTSIRLSPLRWQLLRHSRRCSAFSTSPGHSTTGIQQ